MQLQREYYTFTVPFQHLPIDETYYIHAFITLPQAGGPCSNPQYIYQPQRDQLIDFHRLTASDPASQSVSVNLRVDFPVDGCIGVTGTVSVLIEPTAGGL